MMMFKSRNDWKKTRPEDKAINEEDCPLCKEENDIYIVHETSYWKIIHNKFPLLGLSNHIMAIPKRHVILSKDLTEEEWIDKGNVEDFVEKYYANQEYFSFVRNSLSSRSLAHLHYHYLPGQMRYGALSDMLTKQGF